LDFTTTNEDLDITSSSQEDDDDDETSTTHHTASVMMIHHPLRNASQLFLGVFQLLLSMWIADTAIHAMLQKNNKKKSNKKKN
jgi:hypothetical protein